MDAPSSPWREDRPDSHAVSKLSGAPEQYQAQGRRSSVLVLHPPRPKIFHVHRSEFRDLVQRLTGQRSVSLPSESEAQTHEICVDDFLQGKSSLPPAAAAMSMPDSKNDIFEQAGLAVVAGDYRRGILSPSPSSLPPAAASWQFSPQTPKSQIKQTPQTKKTSQKLHTEAPVCALVDAMFRLPSKLDRLLVSHGHILPRGAGDEIPLIKQDLEKMVAILQEHERSGAEDHSTMVKCLTKEVRELSYDMEDSVDQYLHAADSRRGILSPRRKKYKITRRMSKATSGLREKLKWRLWMANKIREFSLRLQEALQRYSLFNHLGHNGISTTPIGGTGSSTTLTRDAYFGSWYPSPYPLVGIDGYVNKLQEWLGKDGEQKLKVVSVVGSGGIGKTTLAKELYRRINRLFDCRAFVRTSRKPDIRRLLISMLSQIRPHHTPRNWKVHSLIADIRTHLQDKRYLIVIDDVWATQTWDIINRALPAGNLCSGILVTTEVNDVALKCCDYDPKYVLTMEPLGQDDSSKLFFSTVFGPQYDCPPELSEVANILIRKCSGLPLAMVTVASLLANQMGKPAKWDYVNKSLGYGVSTNPSSEGMNHVLNLSYNNLAQHLKACVMYLSIYEEDYILQKDDLVKQWITEGFIRATEGNDIEEISKICFDELISSRMIQPVHTNDNGDVLSCTVHHMVLDFIKHKSLEENFITAIDHSQTTARLTDKVRRLSLQFGNAEATTPTNMTLSQVRTLAFFGVIKCLPSILEFRLLQVLILHLWGDDVSISFDLTGVSELFRLRYFHVTCNANLEVSQIQMRGLKYLETLNIDARVSAVSSDIVHLQGLLHLSLPVETNLPNGIGRMTSLHSLGYFDLSVNSMDNVQSLGELTNLRYLRLTSSTVPSSHLKSKMDNMGSILAKLRNLRSVTLEPSSVLHSGPSSMSIPCDGLSSVSSPPAYLRRFEWLPSVCTFSSIPKWIGHLCKLCILKIGVRELASNDVDILRGLPALTVLSLYIRAKPAERIVFTKTGFSVLKCLKFRCSVPWLEFEVDAMPNLLKLKLIFDARGVDEHVMVPVGITHLTCLKEISAKIGGAGASDPDRRAAESALIDAIKLHPACPTFNIHITLQEQCEIMEKDSMKHHGALQKGSREDAGCRFSAPLDWKNVEAREPNRDQAAMVSDSDLVERLREVLQESDLTTTTTGALRRRLEEDFGVDLSDKKTFVREQIDLLLSELANKAEPVDVPVEEDLVDVILEAGEGEGSGVEKGEEEQQEDEEELLEEDEESSGSRKKRRLGDGKRKAGGFTKLCSISPVLKEFVGASELARTEVVKKLWAYIRENNLQDPTNRRKIVCDERLKKIFNINSIDMFQMNKALSKHIWPLDPEGPVSPKKSTPKEEPQKRDRSEGNKKKGRSSWSGSGLLEPLQLSDDLVKFVGTGETMLSRSDVLKRMWVYIKESGLQDPSDRSKIICDQKLRDLFQVESFTGSTVSKLLNPHFTKAK